MPLWKALGANEGRQAFGKHFQTDAFLSSTVVRPFMSLVLMPTYFLPLIIFSPQYHNPYRYQFSVLEIERYLFLPSHGPPKEPERGGRRTEPQNASTRAHTSKDNHMELHCSSASRASMGRYGPPSCVGPAGMIHMHVQIPYDRGGKRGGRAEEGFGGFLLLQFILALVFIEGSGRVCSCFSPRFFYTHIYMF